MLLHALLAIIIVTIAIALVRLLQKRDRQNTLKLEVLVKERTEQLSEALKREKESQEVIRRQNEVLLEHQNHLDNLVRERTRELLQAKEQAEQSDRVKSSFLTNMSHEIRTPMNAIMGFLSLLKSPDYTREEKTEFIANIEESSHALLRLINDVLDISLLEAGTLRVVERPTDIHLLLTELEQYFRILSSKEVSVEYLNKNEGKPLWLNVDLLRFKQILNNLIDNAIKYTDRGKVGFGFRRENEHICFFVSDTGPGIPKEFHQAIFERFRKIDSTGSRLYPGAGIGLTICKSLVEMLGGTIRVESSPMSGSTFTVVIPARCEVQPPRGFDSSSIHPSEKQPAQFEILIAEDEPVNYQYIKLLLRSVTPNVFYVEDGEQAVDFVRNHRGPKLIALMDIRMPKLNGIDAAKQIRQIRSDVIIIAQTAHTPQALQAGADLSVFDEYLIKPIQPSTLLRSINKCLKQLPT